MAMAMAMATTCSSNLSPFKLFFNSSPVISHLPPSSLTLKRTTSSYFSSSCSSAALKKWLQPARTAILATAAGSTGEHESESEMGEFEEKMEMVEMGGELLFMDQQDEDEDEDSFRTSAVPKKRTSKMKKRIRKNCWKRKAAVAAAKALSLAKSIATGKSTSFMLHKNTHKPSNRFHQSKNTKNNQPRSSIQAIESLSPVEDHEEQPTSVQHSDT